MLQTLILCPDCQQPATQRDGDDTQGRQRYACRPGRRDFTTASMSAFSGYRWPPDVILTAVRWSASYPLSAAQVMQLRAERPIEVSARTVLNWVQTCGPQLAKGCHSHRRRLGRRWYVDEVCCCRGKQQRYLSRAIDQHGQVVDILLRDKRDRVSAKAFCRRALGRTGGIPHTISSDPHQPYGKAVITTLPTACHVGTGWHRARGETTKPIERSHVATVLPGEGYVQRVADQGGTLRGLLKFVHVHEPVIRTVDELFAESLRRLISRVPKSYDDGHAPRHCFFEPRDAARTDASIMMKQAEGRPAGA